MSNDIIDHFIDYQSTMSSEKRERDYVRCQKCKKFLWEAFGFNNNNKTWWYNVDWSIVKIRCWCCQITTPESPNVEPSEQLKKRFMNCNHNFVDRYHQYQDNEMAPNIPNMYCLGCSLWAFQHHIEIKEEDKEEDKEERLPELIP